MSIETVGVVGAGVMGVGVAQSLSTAGYQVILVDISDDILERARATIAKNVRFAAFFDKSPDRPTPEAVLSRIDTHADLEPLSAADFIVENITEDFDLKAQVYPRLDALCGGDAIFAANTSAILITRLGALTKRPDKVLGMHFMNPVPLKPSVEVIRAHHTSDDTLAAALGLLERMGKRGIVVNDAPGFVSNRVLMLTINEAAWLVHDGVATAEQVDDVFVSCFGHKMGPLHTGDLIGLDTILKSLVVLQDQT